MESDRPDRSPSECGGAEENRVWWISSGLNTAIVEYVNDSRVCWTIIIQYHRQCGSAAAAAQGEWNGWAIQFPTSCLKHGIIIYMPGMQNLL